jgi:hypothetical protein
MSDTHKTAREDFRRGRAGIRNNLPLLARAFGADEARTAALLEVATTILDAQEEDEDTSRGLPWPR